MSERKFEKVEMIDMSKRYGATQALDTVSLTVHAGEVMALVGENGAGKSTLMKILAGAVPADSGYVRINGETVDVPDPRTAQELGIAAIYQELELSEDLSVAENIFVGRESESRFGVINYGKLYNRAQTLIDELHIKVDPSARVKDLSIASKQMVEIARAISMNANVVIMDEPTSSLPSVSTGEIDEVSILMGLIDRLRKRGIAVIYVSHRLEEILRISDRMTVLRDGRLVEVFETAKTSPQELVTAMVGRDLKDFYGVARTTTPGSTLAEIEVLDDEGNRIDGFEVREREILGISGLIGAGRSELALSLFGAEKLFRVRVTIDGRSAVFTAPSEAIKAGIGYLPEDRKLQALFLDKAIRMNIAAAVPKRVSRFGILSRTKENALGNKSIEDLNIRTSGLDQRARFLSGGNQQKVVLARWLAVKPKLLILDEPTRGIDVGAKTEVYNLMKTAADDGLAILMISSELPEILAMSDRVLVMRQNEIAGIVDRDEADQERLMSLATGAEGKR